MQNGKMVELLEASAALQDLTVRVPCGAAVFWAASLSTNDRFTTVSPAAIEPFRAAARFHTPPPDR